MAASRMAYTAGEGKTNAVHSTARPSLRTSSAKAGQNQDSANTLQSQPCCSGMWSATTHKYTDVVLLQFQNV